MGAECRPSDRPSAAQSVDRRPSGRGGCGPEGSRLGEGERSCAGLDRAWRYRQQHSTAGKTKHGLWEEQRMTRTAEIVVERDLMVPARDGVLLATDVYRPDGSGPF